MAEAVHHGDVVFGDKIGRDKNVYGPGHAPRPVPAEPPTARTVLLLMANPVGTASLRLLEEYRAIDGAIRRARYRDRIDLRAAPDVRHTDLHEALLEHRPAVVHFSGHGSRTGGIQIGDERGNELVVPPAALEGLFRILSWRVLCVVLNACYTEDQARAIARHVPCVAGMANAVPDGAAIEFATSFYGALAAGESVGTAFRFGRNRIALRGRYGAGNPVLIGEPAAAEVYLAR